MPPTTPASPRSTRRSSILSQPSGRRSEPLLKNATVVLGRQEEHSRQPRNPPGTPGGVFRVPISAEWGPVRSESETPSEPRTGSAFAAIPGARFGFDLAARLQPERGDPAERRPGRADAPP